MKKTIAILLTLMLLLMIPCAALADASSVYQQCTSRVGTSADLYSGMRLTRVVTTDRLGRTSTVVKYVAIPSDAGFVCAVIKASGLPIGLKTSYELRDMTSQITSVTDGALILYRSGTSIVRIGIYAGGSQFYVKSGVVVMETYNAANWNEIRWFDGL